MRVHDPLVDTGSELSMVSESLYSQLSARPLIESFKMPTHDIVGVGGAYAEVNEYINVPFQIAGVQVAHLQLVVFGFSFSILIKINVLRPHSAVMLLEESVPFLMNTRICDICLIRRSDLDQNF